MTRLEAEWLAASMMKEEWPEVWIEPGVLLGDWRVSYRRLPDESPRHAVRLSAGIKARFDRDLARGAKIPPVEVLTCEEAAARTRRLPIGEAPIFQGRPLTDGEILHQTDLSCPRCEDEGRRTVGGLTPCLCRREDGDLICPSHGDVYADLHQAMRRCLPGE